MNSVRAYIGMFKYFGKKWQDKMRCKKLIPYKKLGGYVRYDRLEIDAWIEKHSVVSEESA